MPRAELSMRKSAGAGRPNPFTPEPATRAPDDSEAFLHGLVEGMRCGILTVDASGRLLMANEPARQILELQDGSTAGEPVEVALDRHPQLARVLRESFSMSSLPNRAEMDLHFPEGRDKTIGFTLSMIRAEDGRTVGVAAFFKDLTHVEHREEQERLRDRLASLGQMAANLAHEIRNPLASIEVTCSLLKRRLAPEGSERDLLDKIIAEVRRLNRTITSSLEFVRPLSLSLAMHPLAPLLEEALTVAQGRRGRPELRIERSFAEDLPPLLMDRGQLRQVFENLFLNALEAMGEAGVLTVETAAQAAPASAQTPYPGSADASRDPWRGFTRYAVVRVRDTGPGIPDEHLEKLFYPFFTTKKQGSGVGLSMARKIVDSHRGLLDVESRPGEGATFIVHLPVPADGEE